jgi:hypothetical protein
MVEVADHGGAGEEPDDAERALPHVGQAVRDSRRDERDAARGQPHALIARCRLGLAVEHEYDLLPIDHSLFGQ